MSSSSEIRDSFRDFFAARGHEKIASSPLVPANDPTLMFVNAGMVQFKDVFTGAENRPYKRATTSQKCIRVSGKHNDLENVGVTARHHTFFEMLGNFSFGDYFKEEAISYAWEYLTKEMRLPKDRLVVSVFGGEGTLPADTEAEELWRKIAGLSDERIIRCNAKENFWQMGDTGPCGPCSEIHYDRVGGRDGSLLVNRDDDSLIEVWNLVFIQYDRQADGNLLTLPRQHVDTGMGLERLCSVLQGVKSNYDTDLFTPIFAAIENLPGVEHRYGGKLGAADVGQKDMAFRVLADHARTLVFAITDGATPSNEGRGYVLRRVLRRAVRYGRQMLGARPGFFSRLAPVVVQTMGEAFGELRKDPERVYAIIREEEESFERTLDRGIKLFEEITGAGGSGDVVSGEDAFKLYDTYGFPVDLTQLMAEERGLRVDIAGFEQAMEEQKERSRAATKTGAGAELKLDPDQMARLARMKVEPTDDSNKFHGRDVRASVRAIWNGHNFDEHADTTTAGSRRVGLILDSTNFYAEMGGQVADRGRILVMRERRSNTRDDLQGGEFRVDEVKSFGGYVLHIGRIARGEVRVGDDVQLHIDNARRKAVSANHTATHMLNFALRDVLGEGADQKGSLVADDRLRFDFSRSGAVSPEELGKVEEIVRKMIAADLPVRADLAPLEQAKRIAGLRAVFGEVYPDPVRVVSIGPEVDEMLGDPENDRWRGASVELCGGTHLESTGQAEAFALIGEEAVAKGVRRVVALTGVAAKAAEDAAGGIARRIELAASMDASRLAGEVNDLAGELDQLTLPAARKAALRARLTDLQGSVKAAKKEEAKRRAQEAQQTAARIADSTAMDQVVVAQIDLGSDRDALQAAIGVIAQKRPGAPVMLLSVDEDAGSVAVVAASPKSAIDAGLKAGDWVREVTGVMGGKGGGKPDAAQGAGKDPAKLREGLDAARRFALGKLM